MEKTSNIEVQSVQSDFPQQYSTMRRNSTFNKPLNAQLTIHYRPRENSESFSSSDSSISTGSSNFGGSPLEDDPLSRRNSPLDCMQVIRTELSVEEDSNDNAGFITPTVDSSTRFYSLSSGGINKDICFLPTVEDGDEAEEEKDQDKMVYSDGLPSLPATFAPQANLPAFCNLHQCTSDHHHCHARSFSGSSNCYHSGRTQLTLDTTSVAFEHRVNVKYITAQQRTRGSQVSISPIPEESKFCRDRAASCPASSVGRLLQQRGSVPRLYNSAQGPYTEMALVQEAEDDEEECGGCGEGHSKCEVDDVSSPCHRHHHRRNSIAIRFGKPLYKKL